MHLTKRDIEAAVLYDMAVALAAKASIYHKESVREAVTMLHVEAMRSDEEDAAILRSLAAILEEANQ